jgi:MinD-like ATPase involved in chromosome partitioning or flagellar assembly
VALDIPALPLITARFGGDRSGELSIDGVRETFSAESTEHLREEILTRVTAIAADLGRPVQMTTEDDEGQWMLVVHPNGEIGEEERLVFEPHGPDAEAQLAHAHRAAAAADADAPSDDPESLLADFLTPENHDEVAWHIAADDEAADTVPDTEDEYGEIDESTVLRVEKPAETPDVLRVPPAPVPAETAPAIETAPIAEPVPESGPTVFVPPPPPAPSPSVTAEAAAQPPERASFLAEERQPDRAKKGWRGFLAKTGLPIPASTKELTERSEIHAVSQHWAGPRTIAIVNGKGGANKTPTTAMLAAVFARNGGSGVLAWDNNETRGTLGWRTEQGTHDATVQTLLPSTDHLLSPGAQSSDLSHFVHHQTGDKYDVLRSNPTMLATQQRITTDDFDRLHSVAAKYFRLIFIDSGNDESAERWLRMIDHTDQLVIATTALGEHAEAGALLLEALAQRDERSARLASGAVVVVSQSEKTGSLDSARKVAAGFEPLARQAVAVPYDPAMHGGRLEYSALSGPSRRAWLHAAAAVAEGL